MNAAPLVSLLALAGCAHVAPPERYEFAEEVHQGPIEPKECRESLAARADAAALRGTLLIDEEGRISQENGVAFAQALAGCRFKPATIGGRVVRARFVDARVRRTGPALPYVGARSWFVGDVEMPRGQCDTPAYPPAARAAHVEGRVVMSVGVDDSGRLRSPEIVESASPDLSQASLEAIRRCRMKPARRNGTPVPLRIRYTYTFLLE